MHRCLRCGPIGIIVILALAPAWGQPAAPPATDIYLLPLAGNVHAIIDIKLVAIAAEKGYENQPSFTSDGGTVLFTANRDGKQTDAWAWDRTAARARRLWSTPEAEYSPTLTPDGDYSVIRVEADGTQRLWRFDRTGASPRVILENVKPVGYHAWVDKDLLGLFVLGQPATLQLASVSTGKADVVASGIGRSLHRVPGTRSISFVQRETSDEYWVKQIDVDSRRVEPLVKILPESTDRDVAWMPDGKTLLLSAGTQVYRWRRGEKEWTSILDVTTLGLGAVSRIAASPTGDALAIVVAETR